MRAYSEVIQFTLDRAAVHEEWAAREADQARARELRDEARRFRRIAEMIRRAGDPTRPVSTGRPILVSEWPGRRRTEP